MSRASLFLHTNGTYRFACGSITAYSISKIAPYLEYSNFHNYGVQHLDYSSHNPEHRELTEEKANFLQAAKLSFQTKTLSDGTIVYWHKTGLGVAERHFNTCGEFVNTNGRQEGVQPSYLCGSPDWKQRGDQDHICYRCCCFCPYCEALLTARCALEDNHFDSATLHLSKEEIWSDIQSIENIISDYYLHVPIRELILALRKYNFAQLPLSEVDLCNASNFFAALIAAPEYGDYKNQFISAEDQDFTIEWERIDTQVCLPNETFISFC